MSGVKGSEGRAALNDCSEKASEFEAKLAAAAALAEPSLNPHPSGRAFVVVPKGYDLAYLEAPTLPTRKSGTVQVSDVASFLEMWDRQSIVGSYVYGAMGEIVSSEGKLGRDFGSFSAVFNEHGEGAGWRDHRVVYGIEPSMELITWLKSNKVQFKDTTEFAIFVEENLVDIIEPSPAQFLESVLNFRVKKIESYGAAVRLQDGNVRLDYTSDVSGSTGRSGEIVVPEMIKLGIPVHDGLGAPKYAFEARFRYRLNGGALAIWYELVRPKKVVDTAFADLVKRVEEHIKAKVIWGSPG